MEDDEINATAARRILGLATNVTIYRYAKLGLLSERVERRGLSVRRWYKRSEVERLRDGGLQGLISEETTQ